MANIAQSPTYLIHGSWQKIAREQSWWIYRMWRKPEVGGNVRPYNSKFICRRLIWVAAVYTDALRCGFLFPVSCKIRVRCNSRDAPEIIYIVWVSALGMIGAHPIIHPIFRMVARRVFVRRSSSCSTNRWERLADIPLGCAL